MPPPWRMVAVVRGCQGSDRNITPITMAHTSEIQTETRSASAVMSSRHRDFDFAPSRSTRASVLTMSVGSLIERGRQLRRPHSSQGGTPWPEERRRPWLDTAASIFKMIYKGDSLK